MDLNAAAADDGTPVPPTVGEGSVELCHAALLIVPLRGTAAFCLSLRLRLPNAGTLVFDRCSLTITYCENIYSTSYYDPTPMIVINFVEVSTLL